MQALGFALMCSLFFVIVPAAESYAQDCSRPGTCRHVPGNRPGVRPTPPAPHRPAPAPGVNRPDPRPRPPAPVADRPPRDDERRNPGARPGTRPTPRPGARPPARHTHAPHRNIPRHQPRYSAPRDYHRTLPRHYIVHNRWVLVQTTIHYGYYWDNYPYYVYNGHRHRYSPYEYCDYELVDSYTWQTYTAFYGRTCQTAYDQCADMRDELNWWEYDDRYFCAEPYTGW
jgi:hypothetical protein